MLYIFRFNYHLSKIDGQSGVGCQQYLTSQFRVSWINEAKKAQLTPIEAAIALIFWVASAFMPISDIFGEKGKMVRKLCEQYIIKINSRLDKTLDFFKQNENSAIEIARYRMENMLG